MDFLAWAGITWFALMALTIILTFLREIIQGSVGLDQVWKDFRDISANANFPLLVIVWVIFWIIEEVVKHNRKQEM